ncbi:helix-turn-helix protein [Mucilaginibacter yixingensis]|uniref:Helix-turn-helix protein n=1 Tax=Mucilaginibacter yixingensis TaxID=1295612 RepID=A0A2T5J6K7_9SPHI|nr:helix-turn-helix transcriptional regulator [Mucilaginibacter yixingensis]PTQ94164.1 helix-turn-helix protein [Mucilaginibacter yixingensis]
MSEETRKQQLILLGKHLEALRKRQDLSFRKMAQRCEIDASDIRRYENGEINMSFFTLLELAKGLDIPLKELMTF